MSVRCDHKYMQMISIGLRSKNRIGKPRIEARMALCRAQDTLIRVINVNATLQIFSITFKIVIPAYIFNLCSEVK